MVTLHAITHFFQVHDTIGYILFTLGIALEGEFLLILGGVLAHLGAFTFPLMYVAGFIGACIKTALGYWLGRFLRRKYPKSRFFRFVTRKVGTFLPHFKERPFWSIFISKFIFGVNHFVLVYSGYVHVRRWIYYKAEVLSSLLWVLLFLGLGYIFSIAAFGISHDIRKFTLLLFVFVAGFVILQRIINFILELYETKKELLDEDVYEV